MDDLESQNSDNFGQNYSMTFLDEVCLFINEAAAVRGYSVEFDSVEFDPVDRVKLRNGSS